MYDKKTYTRIHIPEETYRVRHLVFSGGFLKIIFSLLPFRLLAFGRSNRILGEVSEKLCELTELHPLHRHHPHLPTRHRFRNVLRLSLQVHHHRRHRFISFPLFLFASEELQKKQRQAWNLAIFWGWNGFFRIRRFLLCGEFGFLSQFEV